MLIVATIFSLIMMGTLHVQGAKKVHMLCFITMAILAKLIPTISVRNDVITKDSLIVLCLYPLLYLTYMYLTDQHVIETYENLLDKKKVHYKSVRPFIIPLFGDDNT